MKALVFGVTPQDVPAPPPDAPRLLQNLAATPMALQDVDEPKLFGPDWTVLRTRLTGICGSDAKQALLDFDSEAGDNPMSAFISFPQVMGHEVVATVDQAGTEAELEPGQRVVLNPWLSCAPRGISPVCPACDNGDYNLCWNFNDGRITAGIHTGNSSDASGGFADLLPAHKLMAIPVPDAISDEVAVLADPFAVSLHAITRNPPPEGGRVLVYGAGALGTTSGAILAALYPSVEVGVVARFPQQAALAEKRGLKVFVPEPRLDLIEALADWSGGVLRRPWAGLPTCHPGRIDVIYDTVGSPETVEVGIRVLRERGTLVQMGVSSPARFEWTPWYFKELRLVGSNAFGVEEVDGVRKHGIAHYLDLVQDGRIDLDGMLTHTFRLEQWRDALAACADQGSSGALKVAFDFRG
ncbi:MAG: alcohol dehydrogenase catalytic domain-containing protein [Acidimicrobiales bacterium]